MWWVAMGDDVFDDHESPSERDYVSVVVGVVLPVAEYVSTLLPGLHGVDGMLACIARFLKHP